jgi:hypothetical protein
MATADPPHQTTSHSSEALPSSLNGVFIFYSFSVDEKDSIKDKDMTKGHD